MLADDFNHLGIFGRGAVHVTVQVLVAVTLQLFNDPACDELHIRLGSRKVEELATVKQRRTADTDMDLLGAIFEERADIVTQLSTTNDGVVAKDDTPVL